MSVEINHKGTLEQWAIITIREWIRKIRELNIENTGALTNSFEATVVTNAGGDGEKILFTFEYYGKMIDWGVGKGVNVELRDAMSVAGLTKRKKREWYKQLYHELALLKAIYAEKLGIDFNNMVVTSFES